MRPSDTSKLSSHVQDAASQSSGKEDAHLKANPVWWPHSSFQGFGHRWWCHILAVEKVVTSHWPTWHANVLPWNTKARSASIARCGYVLRAATTRDINAPSSIYLAAMSQTLLLLEEACLYKFTQTYGMHFPKYSPKHICTVEVSSFVSIYLFLQLDWYVPISQHVTA